MYEQIENRTKNKKNHLDDSFEYCIDTSTLDAKKGMTVTSVPCQVVRSTTQVYFNIRVDQKRRRAIHFCEQCRYYGRYCDAIHKGSYNSTISFEFRYSFFCLSLVLSIMATGFCRPVSTPLARISISPKIPKSHINFVFEKRYPAEQIQQHIQEQIRQKFTNPEAIWPVRPIPIVGTPNHHDQQHLSALFIPEVVERGTNRTNLFSQQCDK